MSDVHHLYPICSLGWSDCDFGVYLFCGIIAGLLRRIWSFFTASAGYVVRSILRAGILTVSPLLTVPMFMLAGIRGGHGKISQKFYDLFFSLIGEELQESTYFC